MENITEILSREHRVVLDKLDAFERALDARSLDGIWEGARFLEGGLELHRAKEEQVLFPRIARHFPPDQGPAACLSEEHRTEERYVRELRNALEHGDLEKAEEYGHLILDLLRTHIWKEEHVLFPLAERTIQGADRDQVVEEFWNLGVCSPELTRDLVVPGAPHGAFRINPEA